MIKGPIIPIETISYCQTLFSQILLLKCSENEIEGVIKRGKENNSYLENEVEILTKMQGYQGFPKINYIQKDQYGTIKAICMEKLGSSVKNLIRKSYNLKYFIPIKDIVNLGLQMLERIQDLHSNGYLHLDLKPQHFLFKNQNLQNCLYLIDFGLSVKIGVQENAEKTNKTFKGNLNYSSLGRMKCMKYSINDDLQSLVYIIAQMLQGELPWNPRNRKQSQQSWKSLYSKVLGCKLRKNGWKRYGEWIKQVLNSIHTKSDPYYQLRMGICRLLQLQS